MTNENDSFERKPPDTAASPPLTPQQRSRRDVVRQGVKLAFVAPVLSTFFARDAYAASYSCYPTGQTCDGTSKEPCCGGGCNLGVCP